ncbi:MAG: shikimate dehydrogenase [Pseudomonadota bacterium]
MNTRRQKEKPGATPKLAGVVGWPIDHSLSPLIHTIWAHRASIDGYYIPLAVPPAYEDFARVMDGLQAVGFEGVNVTLPHKENALRYASEASPTAEKAGAANMLTFRNRRPYADNSDVAGFAAALQQALGDKKPPSSAVVLGAGGAARGVILAIQSAGVQSILLTNRTRTKVEAIAKDLSVDVAEWRERNELLENAELIINTTSLGMSGQPPLELDVKKLKSEMIVADIVYSPLETDLLKQAKARGCGVIDGLDMLMHQAAPGFRAWFGGDAVVDGALRAALIQELERRGQI